MANYEVIFPFEVIEKVRKGEQVNVVDREKEELWNVNSLTLDEFAEILNAAENNVLRFEFWIRKETKNEQ